MFSIEFCDEPVEYPHDDADIPAAVGEIVLGPFTEIFSSNLSLWSMSDYRTHLARELNLLLTGQEKVALVVSYNDPLRFRNIAIWLVYRDVDVAHFQVQLRFYSHLPLDFDISTISDHIDDREIVDLDGNKISEWDVPIPDIQAFLEGPAQLALAL